MEPTITLYRTGPAGQLHGYRPQTTNRCKRLSPGRHRPLEPVTMAVADFEFDRRCSSCGPYMSDLDLLAETPLGSTPTRWVAIYYRGPAPWPIEVIASRLPGSALADDLGLLAATRGTRKLLGRAPRNRHRHSDTWNDVVQPTRSPMPADADERHRLAATVLAVHADRADLESAFELAAAL